MTIRTSRLSNALRRNQRAFAKTAAFLPSDLSGLQLWVESSPITGYLFTDVGGTVQAANTNTVLHWKDRSSNGRNLSSASLGPVLANTLAAPQPNGKATLDFTSASSHRLSAASATPWPFLHNGVGCTAFIVFKAVDEDLGLLLDTGGLHSGGVGCSLYYDDSGSVEGRMQAVVRNGGATILNLSVASTVNAYPAATWHILRYSYLEGRTNEAQLFGDGCFNVGADSSGAPSAAAPFAALRVGLNVDATAGFGLGGSMGAVILYNRILTDAECRQVENYLSLEFLVPVGNVAVMGDSIVAGYNVSRIPATTLASRLGPLWRATNFAVSGSFIDNATDVKDAQWLHTTAGARRRGYNFMVIMVGINDLKNLDSSAATAFALLEVIYNSVLADPNNRLVVCTLTPFKNDSAYTVGREAERIALNNLIRGFAAANANTYLVDLATVLADPADAEVIWAPYLFGWLHPNQAGTDAMAAAIGDKLLQIGLV